MFEPRRVRIASIGAAVMREVRLEEPEILVGFPPKRDTLSPSGGALWLSERLSRR
jgi:hypothetical protein